MSIASKPLSIIEAMQAAAKGAKVRPVGETRYFVVGHEAKNAVFVAWYELETVWYIPALSDFNAEWEIVEEAAEAQEGA